MQKDSSEEDEKFVDPRLQSNLPKFIVARHPEETETDLTTCREIELQSRHDSKSVRTAKSRRSKRIRRLRRSRSMDSGLNTCVQQPQSIMVSPAASEWVRLTKSQAQITTINLQPESAKKSSREPSSIGKSLRSIFGTTPSGPVAEDEETVRVCRSLGLPCLPDFKVAVNDNNPNAAHITSASPERLSSLTHEPFFHGLLPRSQIESKLKRNGDFLLRESHIAPAKKALSITVKFNDAVKHFLVVTTPKGHYQVGSHTFESVKDLLMWHRLAQVPLCTEGPLLKTPVHRSKWQFTHEQVQIGKKLGEGAFGSVHKAQLTMGVNSFDVAVKLLHDTFAHSRKEREEFMDEFRMMRRLDHPHLVKVYGIAVQQEPLMIVMEFVSGGSLLHYLRRFHHIIQLVDRVRFCSEASNGLRYMEGKRTIHRDVAARNCLLGPQLQVKIADFGLSKADVLYRDKRRMKLPIKWLAPETMSRGEFSLQSDAWSFGVLVWEVFSDGRDPYPGMSNQMVRQQVTRSQYRMSAPPGTPPIISDLMMQCWEEDPNRRPTFAIIHRELSSLHKLLKV